MYYDGRKSYRTGNKPFVPKVNIAVWHLLWTYLPCVAHFCLPRVAPFYCWFHPVIIVDKSLLKALFIARTMSNLVLMLNARLTPSLVIFVVTLYCSVRLDVAGSWCWFVVREKYCWLADAKLVWEKNIAGWHVSWIERLAEYLDYFGLLRISTFSKSQSKLYDHRIKEYPYFISGSLEVERIDAGSSPAVAGGLSGRSEQP